MQVTTEDLLLCEVRFHKCHNVGSSINKEVARSQNFNVIPKIMKRKYNMNSRAKRHDVKKF